MMHALSRDPRALKKEIEYSKKRKVLPYNTGGGFFFREIHTERYYFSEAKEGFFGA